MLSPQEARNAKSSHGGWDEHASLHSTSGPLQISLNHPLQKDLGCLTSSLFREPWAAYHQSTHMFRGEPSTGTSPMRSSSVGIPRPWSSRSHPVSSYGETEHNCRIPFWIKSCPEVKRSIKRVGALSPRTKWLQEANSPQFHLLQVVQSLGLPIIFEVFTLSRIYLKRLKNTHSSIGEK